MRKSAPALSDWPHALIFAAFFSSESKFRVVVPSWSCPSAPWEMRGVGGAHLLPRREHSANLVDPVRAGIQKHDLDLSLPLRLRLDIIHQLLVAWRIRFNESDLLAHL